MALPDSLYRPDGDGWVATELTRGPWNPDHQHAGPPAALLARAIERAGAIEGGETRRLAYDILAPVPLGPVQVDTRVLRAGRRVEQIEATLTSEGSRPLMRATGWRTRTAPSDEVATPEPPPPPPQNARALGLASWPGDDAVAYRDALEWRWVEGSFDVPGPACVWGRVTVPLVTGEPISPLERLLVMADAASGVSAELDWAAWLFVNLDLTIHLERPPEGEWLAMDARTRIGDSGAGVCTAVLSDEHGRVGVSAQALLVEPR